MCPEHEWGKSESEEYKPASIVDQLEEAVENMDPDKVAQAEAAIKEEIEKARAGGQVGAVLGGVFKVLKGLVLAVIAVLTMFTACGCFQAPQSVKDTNAVKREALLLYAKNQALLHAAEQEAYRAEAYAHIDTRFRHDLKTITAKADANGLVPAQQALDWAQKVTAERDANRQAADKRVAEIRAEVQKADKDLQTALRLDALVEQWQNAGAPAEIVTQAAEAIGGFLGPELDEK